MTGVTFSTATLLFFSLNELITALMTSDAVILIMFTCDCGCVSGFIAVLLLFYDRL